MNNSSGSSTSASALCRSNVLQWISLCLFLALLQHVQSFTATPIAGETITRYSFASMVANSMYYQDEPSSTSTKSSFQDRMKRVLNKTPESSKPPKKPSHQESLIPDVTSLKEFKNAVVETDTIVVVRFYAPWCRYV
jgi:thiol:disulfide interchange protein